jgi:uncharacterized protein (UPF0548 family)
VFFFSIPSKATIERFLVQARESPFTYSEIGATRGLIPPLYTTDHNRVRLGSESRDWGRAVGALQLWKMFDTDWVSLYHRSTPIATGENVAILARYFNCYWLNAGRIVYVVDEDGPVCRCGFAYGTLGDHAESGEECFLVEWNRDTDEVWFDLLAFSRPNQFLSRTGYPFARRLQKRFASESKAAMVRAVSGN